MTSARADSARLRIDVPTQRLLAVATGVGLAVVALLVLQFAPEIVRHDDGEVWAYPNFTLSVHDGDFAGRYARALGEEGRAVAWERAVEGLDVDVVSRESGERARLARDGSSKVAVLYYPWSPVARVFADGRSALVWSRWTVLRIQFAPENLGWLLDAGGLRWVEFG